MMTLTPLDSCFPGSASPQFNKGGRREISCKSVSQLGGKVHSFVGLESGANQDKEIDFNLLSRYNAKLNIDALS